MTRPAAARPQTPHRVILAASAGNMLEWYDYFIYGTAAALVFPKLFFPALHGATATIASFLTFASAFVVRPVGAAVWGHFGDRLGRRKVLVSTLAIMGLSTIAIGCLPVADRIGTWAPALLVVLRTVQGLGVSGEYAGAMSMTVEIAPRERRAFYGTWPNVGNSVGLLAATVVFSLLALLPEDQFLAWGWRIPFWLSAALLGVGLYLRTRIGESHVFEEARRRDLLVRAPFAELLRRHKGSLLLGIGVRFCNDVLAYLLLTYTVSYVTTNLGMPPWLSTTAVAVSAACSMVVMPLAGRLADRIGRRPVFAGSAILALVLAVPYFALLDTRNPVLVILAIVLLHCGVVETSYAIVGTYLAELYPANIRYSGIGVTYNVTSIIGAGFAPVIAVALYSAAGNNVYAVSGYIAFAAIVTLIAVRFGRETRGTDLLAPEEASVA
ncbi:MFS transporter [Amycolatopsis nivea]